ncbi:hypothetical protein ACJIZ3_019945 [Penstemon smallii]|uniref:Uncharacterized protein n=1 Tax=Penstemon smallii TaxID=265156 RepID=A0ABD3T3B7_9LAMI
MTRLHPSKTAEELAKMRDIDFQKWLTERVKGHFGLPRFIFEFPVSMSKVFDFSVIRKGFSANKPTIGGLSNLPHHRNGGDFSPVFFQI